MEILDALSRVACFILAVRGLCILNRMSWRACSWFSFVVAGVVLSAGYVVIAGAATHSTELVLILMTMMLLSDRRFAAMRKNLSEQEGTTE